MSHPILPFLHLLACYAVARFGLLLAKMRSHRIEQTLVQFNKSFFYYRWHTLIVGNNTQHLLTTLTMVSALSRTLFILISARSLASESYLHFIGMTLLLSFLCDALPRLLPSRSWELPLWGVITSLICCICTPLVWPLLALFFWWQPTNAEDNLEERLREILHEQHDTPLIQGLLNYFQRSAHDVMTPRIAMVCQEVTTSMQEATKKILEENYTRTPLYAQTIDHIVGTVHSKDILTAYHTHKDTSESIAALAKPPLFIPGTKKLADLLHDFKKHQTHIAIVVDEYGGTEGLITIEDILEEIVGEIEDEHDEKEHFYDRESSGALLVDGSVSLVDLQDKLAIHLPRNGDYESISGFIIAQLGHFPKQGEKVVYNQCEIEVVATNERRIEKVRLTLA